MIKIAEGVTKIGNDAFAGTGDKYIKIILPSTLKEIGDRAFYYCTSLTEIEIPDGVTSIGKQAFYSCFHLARVNIPESVTSIGDGAFADCINLRE